MRGKTASVIRGFNINIVPSVSTVASNVRRMEGTRSEPRNEISSIGSFSGYIDVPTGVSS